MGFPNPIVEIAFNNAADETLYATQGWAEITSWVKSMSGPLRGRQYEVDRSEAGTLSVVLDNTDGDFTPGNATSPFYPNIKSNRRFRVRGKNMVAPNVARAGGADRSTMFFETPTWSGGTYTDGVGSPVWVQHDPAAYPALPVELTDHIEVTVAAGTYTGFRRILSWIVPLEIGVRLAHSAHIWKVSGTEPGGSEGRFEIFYFDNEDVDILGDAGFAGLNRPMERYTGGTPGTPTRRSFSHAPVGTAKYARVVWSVFYGSGVTVSSPITYAITGIQTELPANLAPNPNGNWDPLHWISRGGSEIPVTTGESLQFSWNSVDTVSLYQTIPHLIPGEIYAVTAQVALAAGSPAMILSGDEGATGETAAAPSVAVTDAFTRTLASQWGPATSGGTWAVSGTASEYAANGTAGTHTLVGVDVPHYSRIAATSEHQDLYADITIPVLATGAPIAAGLAKYYNDSNNMLGELLVNTDNTVTARIQIRSGFGNAVVESQTVAGLTHSAGNTYHVRYQMIGNWHRLAVWDGVQVTSPVWLEASNNWFAGSTGAAYSVRSNRETGNTNTSPVISFDNVSFSPLSWSTLETYFEAGQPQNDVELIPQTDPTGTTLWVKGLNVQRVTDPVTEILAPEGQSPSGVTTYERPKDIFEGWIERWPWKVDSDETTITVVDRMKRVGVITLANVVSETLSQDSPGMVVPFNDDPTNNAGTITWSGSWAQDSEASSLMITPSKGDLLTSSYTLGVEGPTEEPAILWDPDNPASVGYYVKMPYSPDYSTPPPVTPTPPPSAPPPTTTKTQYTKVYYATWSRSYDSDGTTRWDDSPYLYHGCYFCSNNQRALVGFNWSAIKSDLAGADIVAIYYTMKNAHARWNYGLSVNLGYHNYSSKPGSWSSSTVSENKWKVHYDELEKKSVGLPASVGYGFKNGTIKGIAVGPAPSNITDNYGFFYGATQSNKPYLTITYKK